MARSHLVDVSSTRWYHCITRCVRHAFLFSDGPIDGKARIDHRLQEPAKFIAISVGGFSVLDDHLHLLVRLDPDTTKGWSDEEVVQLEVSLVPARDKSRQLLRVSESEHRHVAPQDVED
jgi:hypothetical protein